jgi:hypothetical protein
VRLPSNTVPLRQLITPTIKVNALGGNRLAGLNTHLSTLINHTWRLATSVEDNPPSVLGRMAYKHDAVTLRSSTHQQEACVIGACPSPKADEGVIVRATLSEHNHDHRHANPSIGIHQHFNITYLLFFGHFAEAVARVKDLVAPMDRAFGFLTLVDYQQMGNLLASKLTEQGLPPTEIIKLVINRFPDAHMNLQQVLPRGLPEENEGLIFALHPMPLTLPASQWVKTIDSMKPIAQDQPLITALPTAFVRGGTEAKGDYRPETDSFHFEGDQVSEAASVAMDTLVYQFKFFADAFATAVPLPQSQ